MAVLMEVPSVSDSKVSITIFGLNITPTAGYQLTASKYNDRLSPL